MIPIITIRRKNKSGKMITDYSFYYNSLIRKVEEWRICYGKNGTKLLAHKTIKGRTSDPYAFIINLGTMVDHPGMIYKNDRAINWLANAVLQDKFN